MRRTSVSPARRRAFTLLEIAVTFVILGILSSVAVFAYTSIESQTRNTGTQTNLVALISSAQSIADARDGTTWTTDDVQSAVSDLVAAPGPAVLAANTWTLSPVGYSRAYREVSYQINQGSTVLGVATESANQAQNPVCSYAMATIGHVAVAWSRPASVTACSGANALLGQNSTAELAAPPNAPSLTSATGGAGSVALAWNAVSNVATYNIYYAGNPTAIMSVAGTATSVTVSGLTSGVSYSFQISAVAQGGTESPESNVLAAQPTGVANAPTNLAATTGVTGTLTLTWDTNAEPNVTRYYVYQDGTQIQTVIPSASTQTATVSGLAAGSSHSYTVTALNSSGESAQSVAVTGTAGS